MALYIYIYILFFFEKGYILLKVLDIDVGLVGHFGHESGQVSLTYFPSSVGYLLGHTKLNKYGQIGPWSVQSALQIISFFFFFFLIMVDVLWLGQFDPAHNLWSMKHPHGFSEKILGEWFWQDWKSFYHQYKNIHSWLKKKNRLKKKGQREGDIFSLWWECEKWMVEEVKLRSYKMWFGL